MILALPVDHAASSAPPPLLHSHVDHSASRSLREGRGCATRDTSPPLKVAQLRTSQVLCADRRLWAPQKIRAILLHAQGSPGRHGAMPAPGVRLNRGSMPAVASIFNTGKQRCECQGATIFMSDIAQRWRRTGHMYACALINQSTCARPCGGQTRRRPHLTAQGTDTLAPPFHSLHHVSGESSPKRATG